MSFPVKWGQHCLNVLLISYALLSSVSTVATVINAFSNGSKTSSLLTLLSRTGKYFHCQHARAERVIVLFLIKNLGFQRLLKKNTKKTTTIKMNYYCAVLCLIVKHWTDLALMWNLVLMLPCGDFVTAVVILRMRGTTALLLTLVSPLLCLRATLGPHQLPITCFISLFLKFNSGKKLVKEHFTVNCQLFFSNVSCQIILILLFNKYLI